MRPGQWLGSLLTLLLVAVSASAQPRDITVEQMKSEKRLALVIGNGAYSSSPLRNPVNDAHAMAEALEAHGFQVSKSLNAGQKEMRKAVLDFAARLRLGGVGVFYYAGHGLQLNGRNYMVPIDAEINSEEEIEVETVDVSQVLSRMDTARNRVNIVILDACRDNPFARRFRSASRGLAFTNAPSGTLIAYATAPGDVAADGDGPNGLYTAALLQAMKLPGLKIEDLFKRVRAEVQQQTRGRQLPWESSSLVGDFFFAVPGAGSQVGAISASEPKKIETQEEEVRLPNLPGAGPFTAAPTGGIHLYLRTDIPGRVTIYRKVAEIWKQQMLFVAHDPIRSWVLAGRMPNVPSGPVEVRIEGSGDDVIFPVEIQAGRELALHVELREEGNWLASKLRWRLVQAFYADLVGDELVNRKPMLLR